MQGSRGGYQGEKLSLNFQNVEVRRLLQVIGEFTGMNMVVSDSVGGSITLILKDVPWDQALDIILQQKGLDMRKNGNVILIAPREEIATKEKLEFESKAQIGDLEPLRTESYQLNYQKAEAIQKLLTDPNPVSYTHLDVYKRQDIGRLSRIVTLNNISITTDPKTKDGSLVMDAITKTFRYLDEEELAAKKKAAQAAKGQKK